MNWNLDTERELTYDRIVETLGDLFYRKATDRKIVVWATDTAYKEFRRMKKTYMMVNRLMYRNK